jgi:pyridoxal phosphate enzyme (YggS family)
LNASDPRDPASTSARVEPTVAPGPDDAPAIVARLERLRATIARAAAGRPRYPGLHPDVTLIGVAKRQPFAAITAAVAGGLRDVGENYAQELRDKLALAAHPPQLAAQAPVDWHYIGALQRNKLKLLVGQVAWIHTVDSAALVAGIEARAALVAAARPGFVQRVLVEVNLAAEPQKAGVAPDALSSVLDAFAAAPHVRCGGLMCIPPPSDGAAARGWFARLRELAAEAREHPRRGVALEHLSMGMSDDLEAAVAEGATMVRIGTALFGPRPR